MADTVGLRESIRQIDDEVGKLKAANEMRRALLAVIGTPQWDAYREKAQNEIEKLKTSLVRALPQNGDAVGFAHSVGQVQGKITILDRVARGPENLLREIQRAETEIETLTKTAKQRASL